jgi:hypothetical protein
MDITIILLLCEVCKKLQHPFYTRSHYVLQLNCNEIFLQQNDTQQSTVVMAMNIYVNFIYQAANFYLKIKANVNNNIFDLKI